MSCINCKKDFEGKFCPECGEKKDIERITFASVFTTAFEGITQMDKGFLYNLKNLTLKPKETIFKYIEGKRKNIFNPITYALLSISLYLIVTSMFKDRLNYFSEVPDDINKGIMGSAFETGKFIGQRLKYFWLFNIVYLSLFTKMFFKRFNFVEHIAINSFVFGQVTLLAIINYFIFGFLIVLDPLVILATILMLYKIHSNKKNRGEVITLSVLAVFFTYLCFFIIPLSINLLLK